MLVGEPLPRWLPLLALALPAVLRLGRWWAAHLTDERFAALSLAPGLAVSAWLTLLHAVAYGTRSFVAGMVASTLALAALGVALPWRRPAPVPARDERPSRLALALGALTTAVVAAVAVRFDFHDERGTVGHLAFVAQLGRGHYPPRFPLFPDLELGYHYGFDVLAATAGTLLRLTPQRAVDVVSVATWAWLWLVLSRIGQELLSRRASALMPWMVLVGGGVPFLCGSNLFDDRADLVARLVHVCRVEGVSANPTLLSYFFQHPWSAGLPVAFTAFSLALSRRDDRPWARRLALALLCLALSLCQITLFVAVPPALLVAEWARTRSPRHVADLATTLLAALALASRLGGFFAPREVSAVFEAGGVVAPLAPKLVWNALSFGLLAPVGLAGVLLLPRGRAFVAAVVLAALAVLETVRYQYSWDIAKFGVAAAAFLGVGAAVAVHRLARLGVAGGGAAALLVGATSVTSVAFCASLFTQQPAVEETTRAEALHASLTPDDVRVIRWGRAHFAPRDLVMLEPKRRALYAQWGGLAVVALRTEEAFPLSPARVAARAELLDVLPKDEAAYRAHRVRWFVHEPGWSVPVELWIARGTARVRYASGALRVVELLD